MEPTGARLYSLTSYSLSVYRFVTFVEVALEEKSLFLNSLNFRWYYTFAE